MVLKVERIKKKNIDEARIRNAIEIVAQFIIAVFQYNVYLETDILMHFPDALMEIKLHREWIMNR